MRTIDKCIIHCSDSEHSSHDNKETIYKWHVTERGFSDIGYHYLILKDGTIVKCRNVYKNGAHCIGQNRQSIGICLTGKHDFSQAQFIALRKLVSELKWIFGDLSIHGHCDFSTKTCPNFNVHDYV